MNPKSPSQKDDQDDGRTVRAVCGTLAIVFGGIAGMTLFHSLSNTFGWTALFGAITLAQLAFTYRPANNIRYDVSRPRLLGILAASVLPPLLLLLVFFDRLQWRLFLLLIFLLCVSWGPIILLRRFARKPGNTEANRDAA
jgi:hypothetical protein